MPIFAILFQFLIIIVVPLMSMSQSKMIEELKEVVLIQRRKLYLQSAINQVILALMALWALYSMHIAIPIIGYINTNALLIGGVALAIIFTVNIFSKEKEEELNPGLEILIPQTTNEKFTWVFVNIVASICEEIIYRIVVYHLFLVSTNEPIVAAGISALIFGISHSIQGIYGIILSFVFGLCLQYLVHLSNGIVVASLIHFVHNMGSTIIVLHKKAKENSKDE